MFYFYSKSFQCHAASIFLSFLYVIGSMHEKGEFKMGKLKHNGTQRISIRNEIGCSCN